MVAVGVFVARGLVGLDVGDDVDAGAVVELEEAVLEAPELDSLDDSTLPRFKNVFLMEPIAVCGTREPASRDLG